MDSSSGLDSSARISRALARLDLSACPPPRTASPTISGSSTAGESPLSFYSIDIRKDTVCDQQSPEFPSPLKTTFEAVRSGPSLRCASGWSPRVVVGIDIGGYSTGYALARNLQPFSMKSMRISEGGDPGVRALKLPSCLLLCPQLHFHSFGFIARDFFHDLTREEAKTWHFIDFASSQFDSRQSVRGSSMMTARNGRSVSFLKVITLTLIYLRNRVMEELEEEEGCGPEMVSEDDVHWIIAMPSAWDEASRLVLENASHDAQLSSSIIPEKVRIVCSSLASAIFCRSLSDRQEDILVRSSPRFPTRSPGSPRSNKDGHPESLSRSSSGEPNSDTRADSSFLVVDCGADHVTMATLATTKDNSDGSVVERDRRTFAFGGREVDRQFEALLCELLGNTDLSSYRKHFPLDFLRLMAAFEARKRAAFHFAYDDTAAHHNIALPFSLLYFCRKNKRQSIRRLVSEFGDRGLFFTKQGMLRLTGQRMLDLFQRALDQLQRKLLAVLEADPSITLVFFVGGFSQSPIVQQDVLSHFGERLEVVFPTHPGDSVMKGAILSSFRSPPPRSIRPPHSYGVAILQRFLPDQHPASKRIQPAFSFASASPTDWCVDHFDALVRANEPVALDSPIVRTYTPLDMSLKTLCLSVFRSASSTAQFITEAGVEKCADLVFDLTDCAYVAGQQRAFVQVQLVFREEELQLSAQELRSGREVGVSLDWRWRANGGEAEGSKVEEVEEAETEVETICEEEYDDDEEVYL